MKNCDRFAITASIVVVGSALACAEIAAAQCSVTPPPGAIVSPDGCAHTTGGPVDSNGGCNQIPATFTDLGSIPSGGAINVSGQFGTYNPAGTGASTTRDLDWYLVATDGGTLTVTLQTRNSVGTGQMANSVIFIKGNVGSDPCVGNFNVGIQSTVCPHVQTYIGGAGTHLVVVTTPFETTGAAEIYNCGQYLLTLSHTPLNYPVCGTSTADCTAPHTIGGCNLPACCDSVCGFNPICCDVGWDQSCVDQAVTSCGLFIYNCAPPTGAPANDCAISSQLISVGQPNVVVNNAAAGTDGPVGPAATCAAKMGRDLWYTIKAPTDGALGLTTCPTGDATTDTVIELYGLGTDPVVTAARASTLPDLYIGCIDDSCPDASGTVIVGGPTAVTLIDAVGGDYYLIRIGGWYDDTTSGPDAADTFSVTLETDFQYVVYTTGSQHSINSSGVLTNVGLSSGCTAATTPQRWLAQPFSVPASSSEWNVERMTVKGFAPTGVTNTTMNYVVWNRLAGNPAPTAANQRITGSVPYPVGYDNAADDAANASHDIGVAFALPPGNYYLTAYATNASCATIFSNFAWFVSAYDGINLIDGAGSFCWRSSTFPTPGFVRFTLPATFTQPTGVDPADIYNTAFDIFGTPTTTTPPCPADFNGDQVRDGLDMTVILSNWGMAGGDVNGDGTTDGLDMTVLLSGWGACPN
ncbi:MAG: hypothetical protein EXS03_03350 [Phycisphaerales bacterium]|nr:hypothetical protein [Phycisphaerales bacterium]